MFLRQRSRTKEAPGFSFAFLGSKSPSIRGVYDRIIGMEDYQALLTKESFERILELTKSATDPKSLFARAQAYLGLGRQEEGLSLLLRNEEKLFEENALFYMRLVIETRLSLKEFDEAYEDASRFAERPYVSQEVEEALHGLNGYIRAKEREIFLHEEKAPSQIRLLLREEKDDFTLLQMLGKIQSDPLPYRKEVEAVVEGDAHPMVKSFALMLLLSIKSEDPVTITKGGRSFRVVPSTLHAPFTGARFESLKKDISSYTKNTSLNDVASSLFEEYIIARFPEDPLEEEEADELIPSLFLIASEYLQSEDGKTILNQFSEDIQAAIRVNAKRIQNVLDANPPLKY